VAPDAALEGKLPGPEDFYRVFPYRFGQAWWPTSASAGATRPSADHQARLGGRNRGLASAGAGLSFPALVAQWQDAVQKQYLPEIGNRTQGAGDRHRAPDQEERGAALAPGAGAVARRHQIVYLSEKNFYFIDLWLADGNTGKTIHRLLSSSASGNFETFRYMTSSASWSADGKYIALTAAEGRPGRHRHRGRGAQQANPGHPGSDRRGQHPAWSPDGTQLVFSGLDGGISDLYLINADGSGLKRLTNDREADLHPTWSPDGKSIAFTTDRGPSTDFAKLKWGSLRIGIYHLDSGRIDLPAAWGAGRNTIPVGTGRQVARVHLGPERRGQHLPARPARRADLPAH
jgi:hypothetical protein